MIGSASSLDARSYPIPATPPTTAPKELGVLQRIEGMHGGLHEILRLIDRFDRRLDGVPISTDAAANPMPCGLKGLISDSEALIRECVNRLNNLHDAF